MRANTADRWIQSRVSRYGPVSKLSLFGAPTVLLTGLAANRFVFFSGALAMQQPRSVQRILGERSTLDNHGRRPQAHPRCSGRVPLAGHAEAPRRQGRRRGAPPPRRELMERAARRHGVGLLALMKRLTFDITQVAFCSRGTGYVFWTYAVSS
ncbi:hypothetical protein HU200_034333 [Digitaria exilis]|uniref:Uncharacterized protein n=1 Tax=Digitaria exilis TaxID=1010633 RepID=A0A835BK25_9POAL|nr:hypothetical protein HU200_034333 [Digitaria exilis]